MTSEFWVNVVSEKYEDVKQVLAALDIIKERLEESENEITEFDDGSNDSRTKIFLQRLILRLMKTMKLMMSWLTSRKLNRRIIQHTVTPTIQKIIRMTAVLTEITVLALMIIAAIR